MLQLLGGTSVWSCLCMVQVQAEGAAGTQQGWSEGDLWSAQGSHIQAVGLGTTTTNFMPDAGHVAVQKLHTLSSC